MSKNKLHRLGKFVKSGYENSRKRLEANWNFQDEPGALYWEFDVNETADQKLCVIHDRTTRDGKKVAKQTMYGIKNRHPDRLELNELFDIFAALDSDQGYKSLSKPILVEVKRIYSDEGRSELIRAILRARERINSKVEIHCISFDSFRIKHFKKSFPKRNRQSWAYRFGKAKINMLKVGKHNKDLFGNPRFVTRYDGRIEERPIAPSSESLFDRAVGFLRDIF